MKKLKAKIADLEHSDGTRNYGFAAFALDAVNNYREALSTVGAELNPLVGDPSIREFEFFRWLTYEFKVLMSLLTSSADYGGALATEATFNLLEGQGCSHFPALSDGRVLVDDEKARARSSKDLVKCARSFCHTYWIRYGRGKAKCKAVELLVRLVMFLVF